MLNPRIKTENKNRVSILMELRAELEKQTDPGPVGI